MCASRRPAVGSSDWLGLFWSQTRDPYQQHERKHSVNGNGQRANQTLTRRLVSKALCDAFEPPTMDEHEPLRNQVWRVCTRSGVKKAAAGTAHKNTTLQDRAMSRD